jgi:hypothetical protein
MSSGLAAGMAVAILTILSIDGEVSLNTVTVIPACYFPDARNTFSLLKKASPLLQFKKNTYPYFRSL